MDYFFQGIIGLEVFTGKFKETSAEELTKANGHAILCCSKQLLDDVIFICFTLAIPNNLQNDWLHASAATKNKDASAKHLHTRTMFSQFADGDRWPVEIGLYRFDIH